MTDKELDELQENDYLLEFPFGAMCSPMCPGHVMIVREIGKKYIVMERLESFDMHANTIARPRGMMNNYKFVCHLTDEELIKELEDVSMRT